MMHFYIINYKANTIKKPYGPHSLTLTMYLRMNNTSVYTLNNRTMKTFETNRFVLLYLFIYIYIVGNSKLIVG